MGRTLACLCLSPPSAEGGRWGGSGSEGGVLGAVRVLLSSAVSAVQRNPWPFNWLDFSGRLGLGRLGPGQAVTACGRSAFVRLGGIQDFTFPQGPWRKWNCRSFQMPPWTMRWQMLWGMGRYA